ncbi:MAG: WHG domain-containing protein [Actinomycetota bacterium]|nr:WHG domain-containing protein [Actinomycetota bacterium]
MHPAAGRAAAGRHVGLLSCWIRLYGMVCLEVFGHLRFALADAAPMFEAEMRAIAEQLGIPEEYARPPE